ncbi:CU044_2847 family protein [Micromonospora chalcea]|uniref:CU044_2847 family protein n=1 Tax=Micromonospora chalcea TaxID=1874 RepID=UPI00157C7259|nr:CU044_2847 family protein [Micromonospora chalcea]
MPVTRQFAVHGADPVLIEVDGQDLEIHGESAGIGPVGRSGRTEPRSFEESLRSVRAAAVEAMRVFREDLGPSEVKLTFAVKMTAEMNAVIAKTAYEGNLGVELVWRREDSAPR